MKRRCVRVFVSLSIPSLQCLTFSSTILSLQYSQKEDRYEELIRNLSGKLKEVRFSSL